MAWYPAWHITWQRFRYWREQIGFESAYSKIKKEFPRQGTDCVTPQEVDPNLGGSERREVAEQLCEDVAKLRTT